MYKFVIYIVFPMSFFWINELLDIYFNDKTQILLYVKAVSGPTKIKG